jgi:hypothetical protein
MNINISINQTLIQEALAFENQETKRDVVEKE